MATFQVIGTVNVAQQGKIDNHQPVHFHFHKDGSMSMTQESNEEPQKTELVQEPAKDYKPQFKYFTSKAILLGIAQSLEDAICAACHSTVLEFNSVMDHLSKEGLIDIRYVKKSVLYRHVDELYSVSFTYEYYRHKS